MTDVIDIPATAPATPPARRGRRHLDGSPPGEGAYMRDVSVSLPPRDVAALEEIGGGNRSAAVRLLLETWRERDEQPDDGTRDTEPERPARQQRGGRLDPAAATP